MLITAGSTKEAGPTCALSRATEALSLVMTNPYMLKKLKLFVAKSWLPQSSDSDPSYTAEGPAVAVNFIDFCCDVGDFRKLPACLFQYFQASHIYQTYIMHGAVKRIPISICISDEITDRLSCRLDDQDPELFSLALGEAVEFLSIEVFPAYSSVHPCLGASDQKDEVYLQHGRFPTVAYLTLSVSMLCRWLNFCTQ